MLMRDPVTFVGFIAACSVIFVMLTCVVAYRVLTKYIARRDLTVAHATGRYADWCDIVARLREGPSTFIWLPGWDKVPELWWSSIDIGAMYEAATTLQVHDDARTA